MRRARHPRSVGTGALALALIAVAAGGCGSSGTEPSDAGSTPTAPPPGTAARACASATAGVSTLRATGVNCSAGTDVAAAWSRKSACAAPAGASRTSCTVGAYRCLGTATERGLAVSCARPNRSISFLAKRG